MRIRWRRLPLVGQIIVAAAMIEIGVLGVGYLAQTRVVDGAVTNLAHSYSRQMGPVLASAMVGPLVERDYAAIQAIADETVTEDGIYQLEVKDARGLRVAASVYPGRKDVLEQQTLLEMTQRVKTGERELGVITMRFSREPLNQVAAGLSVRRTVGVAVALLLSTLAAWLLGSWIARPLKQLSTASRRLAQGDYDVDPGRSAGVEIAQLEHNFAIMAASIHDQIETLRKNEAEQRRLSQEAQAQAQRADDARRQAEEASRAKSEFLSKVSHEIRTPLNGLLGMIDLLRETPLDASQGDMAEVASQSGMALLAIINDILDYYKVQSGQFQIHRETFDLHALLHGIVELFRPSAKGKGLALDLRVSRETPQWIEGDALRLRQVVSNLLGNAIKFTQHGAITLAAQTQAGARGGRQLTIRVEDTGMGISPASLEQVFEPFVQADNSLTRQFGGTGLGLSISRTLSQAMGGDLTASSVLGSGSVFTVSLPVEEASQPAPGAAGPGGALAPLPGLRVLLVEDHPVNIKLAQRILERFGCVVTVAHDGQQALDRHAIGAFDLILMDCQMPVMDGFEATRHIRERERVVKGPRTPIVALTANASESDRQACLEQGMDEMISKPYSAARLHEVLAQYAPGTPSA